MLSSIAPRFFCLDIPDGARGDSGTLHLTLAYPDAVTPASLGLSEDTRRLALMVRSVRLFEKPAATAILPRSLAPLRMSEATPEALDEAVRTRTGIGTIELLRGFESLGHNCEFGLMQRDLDAEPLGLLRFGGIDLASLLAGLDCAFAGIEDPAGLSLESGRMNGRAEYLVRDAQFGVRIHTGQFLDEGPAGRGGPAPHGAPFGLSAAPVRRGSARGQPHLRAAPSGPAR